MPRVQDGQERQPLPAVIFWFMVKAIATALSLDPAARRDNEGTVSSESQELEEGLGNVSDTTGGSNGPLDTKIPHVASRRRMQRSCGFCWYSCRGLLWKTFVVLCLLVIGWNILASVLWVIRSIFFGISAVFLIGWHLVILIFCVLVPGPTGLEGMPTFSTSLSGLNAPYTHTSTHMVPVQFGHEMRILGNAFGTLTIVQDLSNATEIRYETIIRSEQESILNTFLAQHPDVWDRRVDDMQSHMKLSAFCSSPVCLRYDVTMNIPANLKNLFVQTSTVTQIKFDSDSTFDLNAITVRMTSSAGDTNQLLLPHAGVRAKTLWLEVADGWLVGDVAIVNETTLVTVAGEAVMNVRVHPVPSDAPSTTAYLETTGGRGRSDVMYLSNPGHRHRPIYSKHVSTNADLIMSYEHADFNGKVNVVARCRSMGSIAGARDMSWVGKNDGNDTVIAQSRKGFVGFYYAAEIPWIGHLRSWEPTLAMKRGLC